MKVCAIKYNGLPGDPYILPDGKIAKQVCVVGTV